MDIRRRDFIDRIQQNARDGIDLGSNRAAVQSLTSQGITDAQLRRIAGSDRVISGDQELNQLYDLLQQRGGGRVDARVTEGLFRALEAQVGAPASPARAGELGHAARRAPATTGLFARTGVRRQAGIQALSAADRSATPEQTTQSLLARAQNAHPNDQIRFQIGDETLTAGELSLMHRRDPQRFADFLNRHGISRAEFNEIVDDVVSSGPRAGHTYDLRPGSDLARAYRVGGRDGAVVDAHLDPTRLQARAAANDSAAQRTDLSDQQVQAPGFWQQVGDAIMEAIGWISRLFGGDFDPDTQTFDGAAGEGFDFTALGQQHAQGPRAYELNALLSTPDGAQRLRQELLSQKPDSATDLQWSRAVDEYVTGLQAGLRSQPASTRGPDMSPREAQLALGYLRANGYSAQARADLDAVQAQPEPIRSQAMELLTSLPDAERANMLSLLRAPTSDRMPQGLSSADESRWWRSREFHTASPDQKQAMFDLMRRDGFQSDLSSPQVAEGFRAVEIAEDVPASVRQRYLASVVSMGLPRAHLASDFQDGLGALLKAQPNRADEIMSEFEANLTASTDAQSRALAGRTFSLRSVDPSLGDITRRSDQRAVVSLFERNNLSLRRRHNGQDFTISARGGPGANDVSLDRYFSDRAYRTQVLTNMGMDRTSFERMLGNVSGTMGDGRAAGDAAFRQQTIQDLEREIANPATTAERRATARQELRVERHALQQERSPTNVEIDISAGSQADRLFGLDGQGPSVTQRLARHRLADRPRDDLAVTVQGRSGPVQIKGEDLSKLLRDHPDDAGARAAFEAAYPGVDFDETVLLFSNLGSRVYDGSLSTPSDGSRLELDFTQRQSDRSLEGLRRAYTDGRSGNIAPGGDFDATLESRSTATARSVDDARATARAGGAAGNNWFQFGIFNRADGYTSSKHMASRARARFQAAGNQPNPAHALGAVLDMDRFDRAEMANGTRYQQNGVAAGRGPDTYLVDPRTGARAEGRDLQVLSFVGRGRRDQRAFGATVDRVQDSFRRYGGVPQSNMETYRNASPGEMYDAVAAEIQRDPRPADQRTDANGHARPRVIVVHFAGHTVSNRNDAGVLGMGLRGGELTPDQVAQLNQMAKDNGVNIVWCTDACRAGEYVDQSRSARIDELRAAGTLDADVDHLDGLRTALVDRHQALTEVRNLRIPPANRRSPCQAGACPAPGYGPVNAPDADRLARMGAAALQGGAGSQAMRDLEGLVDRINHDVTLTDAQKAVYNRYLGAIQDTVQHREALRGRPDVDQSILSEGLVDGSARWRHGRRFMSGTMGPTADKINAELRRRMPE